MLFVAAAMVVALAGEGDADVDLRHGAVHLGRHLHLWPPARAGEGVEDSPPRLAPPPQPPHARNAFFAQHTAFFSSVPAMPLPHRNRRPTALRPGSARPAATTTPPRCARSSTTGTPPSACSTSPSRCVARTPVAAPGRRPTPPALRCGSPKGLRGAWDGPRAVGVAGAEGARRARARGGGFSCAAQARPEVMLVMHNAHYNAAFPVPHKMRHMYVYK